MPNNKTNHLKRIVYHFPDKLCVATERNCSSIHTIGPEKPPGFKQSIENNLHAYMTNLSQGSEHKKIKHNIPNKLNYRSSNKHSSFIYSSPIKTYFLTTVTLRIFLYCNTTVTLWICPYHNTSVPLWIRPYHNNTFPYQTLL